MKILFVRSSNDGIDPVTTNQGNSLESLGLDVDYFNIRGRGITGYLKNVLRLRKQIRAIRPDLIHAHYALSGFLASLSAGKLPVGVSLMGCDVNKKDSLIPYISRFFSRHFWKFVIVKSDEMYSNIHNSGAVVLPNGVDLSKYSEISQKSACERLKWEEKKKHILFASDPKREEKNFPLADQSLKLLKEKGISFELHFLCGIDSEKMVWHYNAADLLLLTSVREGSPNVVKEALACNCPVVSTRVGDVAGLLDGLQNCTVVDAVPDEIASAMYSILNSATRTDSRRKIKHLDSRLIAVEIKKIYERTVKK